LKKIFLKFFLQKKKSVKYFIFKNLNTNLEKIQIFFSEYFIPDFYKIFFEIKILEKKIIFFSKLKGHFLFF